MEPVAAYQLGIVGATVAHLGKKHLDAIKLLVPPVKLCEELNVWAHMRQLKHFEIEAAREARDRLLPKLMSGEIDVVGPTTGNMVL